MIGSRLFLAKQKLKAVEECLSSDVSIWRAAGETCSRFEGAKLSLTDTLPFFDFGLRLNFKLTWRFGSQVCCLLQIRSTQHVQPPISSYSQSLVATEPSQAKPSQSSNWRRRLARSASMRPPCLLAIAAFERIAGLNNKHLNSNRGICLR